MTAHISYLSSMCYIFIFFRFLNAHYDMASEIYIYQTKKFYTIGVFKPGIDSFVIHYSLVIYG